MKINKNFVSAIGAIIGGCLIYILVGIQRSLCYYAGDKGIGAEEIQSLRENCVNSAGSAAQRVILGAITAYMIVFLVSLFIEKVMLMRKGNGFRKWGASRQLEFIGLFFAIIFFIASIIRSWTIATCTDDIKCPFFDPLHALLFLLTFISLFVFLVTNFNKVKGIILGIFGLLILLLLLV